MNPPPTVSVIIPVKGRSSLFAVTAQSLAAQTCGDWEAIVVDDGSPPDEFARVAEIVRSDARFRLLRNPGPRRGACACRNAGFAASAGRYVIFLDSDDALAPSCLQRRIEIMNRNPTVDFAVFLLGIFLTQPGDSDLLWNIFTEENDLDRFLHSDDAPWGTPGPIWRRESLLRTGLWEERALSWQDWEFHLRALAAGPRYMKISELDAYWRRETPAGSVSGLRASPRHVLNHAQLLRRTAACLRRNGQMTPPRRRILATHFFRLAFRANLPRRRAARVWRAGRRARIVSLFEYGAVLACEFLARAAGRVSRRLEQGVYPDLRRTPRFGLKRMPAPPAPPAPCAP